MFFTVFLSSTTSLNSSISKAFLIKRDWNDWYEFETSFSLIVFDEKGEQHDFGSVKIGQFSMVENQRTPKIPSEFDELSSSNFFSLGQTDSYYESLKELSLPLKDKILTGLRDVVADLSLFDKSLNERVTNISLLRSVDPVSVRGQFRRLVEGGSRLSRYSFSYQAPIRRENEPLIVLDFEVVPESNPPTNIHILIGRNGVGKTRILQYITRSLIEKDASSNDVGMFTSQEMINNAGIFANLVSVTFSAFDDFEPLSEKRDKSVGIRYSYIGLKSLKEDGEQSNLAPNTPDGLASDFVKSINTCRQTSRVSRWRRSLEMLEADPIFKETEVSSLVDDIENESFEEKARKLFKNLSSGHKIVLLTMTRLVETVEERTLILLDEPEAHLHPPLLSAFVRALSDLLIYRNGVAIIATHSPVVLQEVPKSCAWKLRRTGYESIVERPEIETFGENAGVLTREIFGLEVTQSGFHKLLQTAVERGEDFASTCDRFDNKLGAEARAILRGLIIARDSEEDL